jgi:hypothetical protein
VFAVVLLVITAAMFFMGWLTANHPANDPPVSFPMSVCWCVLGAMVSVAAGGVVLMDHGIRLEKRLRVLEHQRGECEDA